MQDLFNDTGFVPAPQFDEPGRLEFYLLRRILPLVGKPARYLGSSLADKETGRTGRDAPLRPGDANILLSFPDAYEIGMSHTGLRILYDVLRCRKDTRVDLAFTPWPDMEKLMRQAGMPLFALDSRLPARKFDVWGFSLGYELAYTNVLTMIDLAGIPLLAHRRRDGDPVIIAGGACTHNPSVVAPFFDLLFPGDGEEAVIDVAAVVEDWKADGADRAALCDRLAELPGAWRPGSGRKKARVLPDINSFETPRPLVPVFESVHDRLTLEIMRGCARGCRFCQAGMINRPVRERSTEALVSSAVSGSQVGGWGEISLLSLSSSDYSQLGSLVPAIRDGVDDPYVDVVLPSLRIDSLDEDFCRQVGRASGGNFTFAPEAGSQRLRDVINKQITEEEILSTIGRAFSVGAKTVKLYFMIGLPTETDDDLEEMIALVGKIVSLAPRGGGQISVSVSPFAPKPHTPFQWAGQITRAEIERRNAWIEKELRRWKVKVGLRHADVSRLEAVMGLGDGRIAEVVARAWLAGARFDSWSENFRPGTWERAFTDSDIDPRTYLEPRDVDAVLPWDEIGAAVDRDFLAEDWQRAQRAETLPDCRLDGECYDCSACEAPLKHIEAEPPGEVPSAGAPGATPARPDGERDFDPRNADPNDPSLEQRKWTIWRGQTAAKCWYRVEYAREGDCAFLGHLDFQRQLQLALKRSGLPIAFSKGYHPHPLMKFGPPLPVGVAGEREVFDIALLHREPGWETNLNRALPEGLRILRSRTVGAITPGSIDVFARRQDYRAELSSGFETELTIDAVGEICRRFLDSEHWPFMRHRPKGDVEVDARSLIRDGSLTWRQVDGNNDEEQRIVLEFSLVREEGSSSLPVHGFLTALMSDALPESRFCRVWRTGYRGRNHRGCWLTPFEEVGDANRRVWLGTQFNA